MAHAGLTQGESVRIAQAVESGALRRLLAEMQGLWAVMPGQELRALHMREADAAPH